MASSHRGLRLPQSRRLLLGRGECQHVQGTGCGRHDYERFRFFSSSVLVSHAYVHIVEYGGPVIVGGLTVRPGDLLHGDEHGVTSIPLEIAGNISQAAQVIEAAERRLIDYARSPARPPEGLAEMYGKVD
ncbi:MAG: hypothetical protein E6J42_11610 [Chloroflexi bacterium]|nr:MAG: hypothetical protein E6J42_11610 [Chloroflexota bacterium]